MAKRQPVKAAGRLALYGSTRYSSKGSTKKAPRAKAYGMGVAGAVVGSGVGRVVGGKLGGASGAQLGSNLGAGLGVHVGIRGAHKAGYVRRDKQHLTGRVLGSPYGKADPSFHGSVGHHQNAKPAPRRH